MSIAIALGLGGAVAFAQEQNIGSRVPTKDEIIDMLAPAEDQGGATEAPAGKTRGISMEPVHQAIKGHSAKPKAERAVSLQVYFDYNSDLLSEDARKQLGPVGEALASSKLKTVEFTIEGHTDSKGGSGYNQQLSERRATAVKEFLVSEYGIDGSRIRAVGKGKSTPFDKANPEGGVNRRVRIVAGR
jgi:outer membrane protein OmpA-like peptidoglycan-associated protein